jgi:hypothetical protein
VSGIDILNLQNSQASYDPLPHLAEGVPLHKVSCVNHFSSQEAFPEFVRGEVMKPLELAELLVNPH